MIRVELSNRLGNNLFQYAHGRGLAARHGTNVMVTGVASRLKTLRLRDDTLFADAAEADALAAAAGRPWTPYHQTDGFAYDPSVEALPDRTLLLGYWQSERYFSHISEEIRAEFRLIESLDRTDPHLVDHITSTESIAVHVRRGDYVSVPRATRGHGILGPAYYRNALSELARQGVEGEIFGFSDEPDWCRDHLDFGRPTTWLPANREAPERDLMLFAACRHHVIANSSFSWWGAWLGDAPDQVVIAPRRWFDGYDHDTRDLLPDRWTQVANPPTLDRVGLRRVARTVLRPLGLIGPEGGVELPRSKGIRPH